jgi:hypothetical protein
MGRPLCAARLLRYHKIYDKAGAHALVARNHCDNIRRQQEQTSYTGELSCVRPSKDGCWGWGATSEKLLSSVSILYFYISRTRRTLVFDRNLKGQNFPTFLPVSVPCLPVVGRRRQTCV